MKQGDVHNQTRAMLRQFARMFVRLVAEASGIALHLPASWSGALLVWMLASTALVLPVTLAEHRHGDRRSLIASLPIENTSGTSLDSFHQALALTREQQSITPDESPAITRILHYGDSHVAADMLTGTLRELFQRDFGDAGAGFIRPVALKGYARPRELSFFSSGWRSDGLSLSSLLMDGRFGLSGISFSTTLAGEIIRLNSDCTRFEFYLLKQPGGGAVNLALDGEVQHKNFSLNAEQFEPVTLEIEVPADTRNDNAHSIELRTAAPGAVRLLGVIAERHRAGVVYDSLGINGARATRLLQWNESVLASDLAERDPDLIVVAYGSNEADDADFDAATYQQKFTAALERLRRAVPRASLLVIAPPDRATRVNGRWQSLRTLPGLVAAQRQAARNTGAAFWNLYQAMGGAGAINRWTLRSPPLAQPDRVHLTRVGYQLIAEALYRQLMIARTTDN